MNIITLNALLQFYFHQDNNVFHQDIFTNTNHNINQLIR